MLKRGRKSRIEKWTQSANIKTLASLARRGVSEHEIAEKIGIDEATLITWKKKSIAIKEALEGREMSICQVEDSMYREALGYYYSEEVVTNKGEIVSLQRYKVPSLQAQIFFLKNRAPRWWTDRREVKYTEQTEKNVVVKWGTKDGNRDSSLPASCGSGEDACE